MGIKRKEILDLLQTDDATPSLLYWNDILLFFQNNKPQLDLEDVQILADESERCRTYWNLDKIETITIVKNGHEMKMKRKVMGLDISKDSVYTDIYSYLDYLDRMVYKVEEDEVQHLRTGTNDLALVAAPA